MASVYNVNGKKIVFMHIPKTGGQSIQAVLKPYAIESESLLIKGHLDYEHICLAVNNRFVIDMAFTVVRNPYDRFHSWFYYIRDFNPIITGMDFTHHAFQGKTFNEGVEWVKKTKRKDLTPNLYHTVDRTPLLVKAQADFVGGFDCVCLKLENIDREFNGLFKKFGLPEQEMPVVGKSNNIDYRDDYNEESKDTIRTMFADDFKSFDYSTEF